jgi:single-strand DNA-binding protein
MYAKATVIGNLGADPETRYTKSGTMNVNFRIATNRRWTDQSGQQQEKTNWFRVTAWGKLGETLDKMTQDGWLTKGRQVFVTGRIDLGDPYTTQQGETRQTMEITADDVVLVGNRPDGMGAGGQGQGRSREDTPTSDEVDDLPF